ncbi:MAG: C4-dicarboxylate transporter DctA [Leadbetterella sp.]
MTKILSKLYVQVIIGLILGVLCGFLFPQAAGFGEILSKKFIDLIKMIIAPIIFFTIVLGIAKAQSMGKVGRVGGKGLLYFEIVTTFAIVIGLAVGYIFEPGKGVSTSNIDVKKVEKYITQAKEHNWIDFVTHIIPDNAFKSFAEGDMLQILVFSVLFGFGLNKMGDKSQGLITTFENISKVLFNIMHFVMKLAPLGAFGGMVFTVGKFGIVTLLSLLKFMGTFYITVFLFIVIVLNIIAKANGFSLFKLIKYIREEILIALGASSSEPVLPNLMKKLEQAGCKKDVVGLIIPTGYSFNLDGTSIYLSMAIVFLAQAYNKTLGIQEILTIVGVLMLTSKGAAGVTGSGFIVLASTLSIVKVVPVEGLALIVGIDRFMSEARTITNLIGNTVATVVIAKSEKELDWEVYRKVVG